MRLTDILHSQSIKVPLQATQKQQAIFELVDLLADQAGLNNRETLKQAVWQREMTRTTGIGHGIGIPHGKVRDCDRLHLAVGRLAQPIDFDAIDRKPVELVLLLVSPEDQTGPHIQALAQISRLLTDAKLRESLISAASAEAMFQLISDYESQMTA